MPNVLKERMHKNIRYFWKNVLKESNVLKEKGMMPMMAIWMRFTWIEMNDANDGNMNDVHVNRKEWCSSYDVP